MENSEEIKDKPAFIKTKPEPEPELNVPPEAIEPALPEKPEEVVLFDKECFIVKDVDGNIIISDKGTCDPEKYNKMLEVIEKGGKTIYKRSKKKKAEL